MKRKEYNLQRHFTTTHDKCDALRCCAVLCLCTKLKKNKKAASKLFFPHMKLQGLQSGKHPAFSRWMLPPKHEEERKKPE